MLNANSRPQLDKRIGKMILLGNTLIRTDEKLGIGFRYLPEGGVWESWHLKWKPSTALFFPAYDHSPGPVVWRPGDFTTWRQGI